MNFTWDEQKNAANQAKHRVSFEEASSLFLSGVDYLEVFDEAHSEEEDRFIASGQSIVVSFSSCGRSKMKKPYGLSAHAQRPSASEHTTSFMEQRR